MARPLDIRYVTLVCPYFIWLFGIESGFVLVGMGSIRFLCIGFSNVFFLRECEHNFLALKVYVITFITK